MLNHVRMKKNDDENYEPLVVYLTPGKTPIAYENRVQCLMMSGMDRLEAERFALEPIELELYYEIGYGLFAVDSEAVDSNGVASPYTKEELCDD